MDLGGAGALGLVAGEWLGLGWLSGVGWPEQPHALWAARWALRLLVGSCLVAFAQLVLAGVGLGFGSPLVTLALAALGAVGLRALQPRASWADKELTLERREQVGWLVLGGVLVAAAVRALVVPEAGWDAYSHWGLRAQAFAVHGTIVNAHSEHEYYPPLVPLLEAWLYVHRGGVSIDLGKTIWALVGGAFGICLAWHLRLWLRTAWVAPLAAAGVVVGATSLLESFWTGQADLPLTAYLTLATLAAAQWLRTLNRGWLVQVGVFAAAAALTKFEGLPRVGVVAVAVLLESVLLCRERRGILAALVLLAPAAAAAAVWTALELTRGIAPNEEHLGPLQPFALGGVLVSLVAVLGGLRTGGGVLVVIAAWAVAGASILDRSVRLITLVVMGQLAATLVALLASSAGPDVEVRTSATRLLEQFMPLALFAGALGLAARIGTYNRRGR